MKSVSAIVWLAPLLLALSACHALRAKSCHGPQAYMGAKSVAPLKIPAGLDAPETGSALRIPALDEPAPPARSEEHTSELQSRSDLVCRLLLEKKKTKDPIEYSTAGRD